MLRYTLCLTLLVTASCSPGRHMLFGSQQGEVDELNALRKENNELHAWNNELHARNNELHARIKSLEGRSPTTMCTRCEAESKPTETFLFVQKAAECRIEVELGTTMIIFDDIVSSVTTQFSDRPFRFASKVNTSEFFETFVTRFGDDPPNGAFLVERDDLELGPFVASMVPKMVDGKVAYALTQSPAQRTDRNLAEIVDSESIFTNCVGLIDNMDAVADGRSVDDMLESLEPIAKAFFFSPEGQAQFLPAQDKDQYRVYVDQARNGGPAHPNDHIIVAKTADTEVEAKNLLQNNNLFGKSPVRGEFLSSVPRKSIEKIPKRKAGALYPAADTDAMTEWGKFLSASTFSDDERILYQSIQKKDVETMFNVIKMKETATEVKKTFGTAGVWYPWEYAESAVSEVVRGRLKGKKKMYDAAVYFELRTQERDGRAIDEKIGNRVYSKYDLWANKDFLKAAKDTVIDPAAMTEAIQKFADPMVTTTSDTNDLARKLTTVLTGPEYFEVKKEFEEGLSSIAKAILPTMMIPPAGGISSKLLFSQLSQNDWALVKGCCAKTKSAEKLLDSITASDREIMAKLYNDYGLLQLNEFQFVADSITELYTIPEKLLKDMTGVLASSMIDEDIALVDSQVKFFENEMKKLGEGQKWGNKEVKDFENEMKSKGVNPRDVEESAEVPLEKHRERLEELNELKTGEKTVYERGKDSEIDLQIVDAVKNLRTKDVKLEDATKDKIIEIRDRLKLKIREEKDEAQNDLQKLQNRDLSKSRELLEFIQKLLGFKTEFMKLEEQAKDNLEGFEKALNELKAVQPVEPERMKSVDFEALEKLDDEATGYIKWMKSGGTKPELSEEMKTLFEESDASEEDFMTKYFFKNVQGKVMANYKDYKDFVAGWKSDDPDETAPSFEEWKSSNNPDSSSPANLDTADMDQIQDLSMEKEAATEGAKDYESALGGKVENALDNYVGELGNDALGELTEKGMTELMTEGAADMLEHLV